MKLNLNLVPKSVVAVALSGGRDSMVLLDMLRKEDVKVKAICVEHGIRGEISKLESKKVFEFCNNLGVECRVYSVDVPKVAKERKLTIEQTARELRYQCFEKALDEGFCDYIATAHHADDNAETILMRIMRGTGAKGLTGISERRDRYIRPLLKVTRDEIDEYVEKNGIVYFEDETNTSTEYTRNFIRHEIMPKLKERYPQVVKSITRLSESIRRDEEYFETIVNKKIVDLGGAWGIRVEDLDIPAIGERLIRRAFLNLGVTADVEERHVELVKSLVCMENGTSFDMPYDTICTKEYELITIYKRQSQNEQEVVLRGENTYLFGDRKIVVELCDKRDKGIYVDYQKVEGAVFRQRRDGDTFKRYGGGTKSLGDYLTDIKLPIRQRDQLIVLAKGNEVLAILGVEISDKAKIDDTTTRIVQLKVE